MTRHPYAFLARVSSEPSVHRMAQLLMFGCYKQTEFVICSLAFVQLLFGHAGVQRLQYKTARCTVAEENRTGQDGIEYKRTLEKN